MNNIYTLFRNDVLNTGDDVISILEKVSVSSVFDSDELLEYLDKFRNKAPKTLIQRVKSFHQSTLNLDLKIPDLAEIRLN